MIYKGSIFTFSFENFLLFFPLARHMCNSSRVFALRALELQCALLYNINWVYVFFILQYNYLCIAQSSAWKDKIEMHYVATYPMSGVYQFGYPVQFSLCLIEAVPLNTAFKV
ncbi:hypothetical protein ANANG_G00104840 [Anguilla anguilla]|uniref:Uncharacterized protein n=1 Tax=Anguilla anguilla TaxID=7936 RepID=A0A9D3MHA2_ANGAN|nr:hypothetical protein ANANG_G00104840 [Anguilla anguilla]